MVPTVELPPGVPFTIQLTLELAESLTETVNCWEFPACTTAAVGETDTLALAGAMPVPAIVTTGSMDALLVIVTVPVAVPEVEGVKATVNVKL